MSAIRVTAINLQEVVAGIQYDKDTAAAIKYTQEVAPTVARLALQCQSQVHLVEDKQIIIPDSKQSYILKNTHHNSYAFGPGKLNHLTLTGVSDVSITLDAAISGVDFLQCKNVRLTVTRSTACNLEFCCGINIIGPAIIEASHSEDITVNGQTMHVNVFTTNEARGTNVNTQVLT